MKRVTLVDWCPMWYLCSMQPQRNIYAIMWGRIWFLPCSKIRYAAQCKFLFSWFWGACLWSGGQLLSKYLTQLTPNYKVAKEKWHATMSPLSCHLVNMVAWPWTTPEHLAIRGYKIPFPPSLSNHETPFPEKEDLEQPKTMTQGFFQHHSKLKLYISFLSLREIMSKHCFNSHFKNNYYRF